MYENIKQVKEAMFENLGFNVLLSPLSSKDIVQLSQDYCLEETCYPIKLIYGHIAWLLSQNVDYIVLPRLYTVTHKGSNARKNYSCMYMQTSPLMMERAFRLKERGVTLIAPELSLNFGKKYMIDAILSIAGTIGIPKPRMVPAAMAGVTALFSHSDRLETLAKNYLDTEEPIIVLVSRVYNLVDPVLNTGIEEHLNRLGVHVIHLEHLEVDEHSSGVGVITRVEAFLYSIRNKHPSMQRKALSETHYPKQALLYPDYGRYTELPIPYL